MKYITLSSLINHRLEVLTVREFAAKIKVSPSTVSRIRKGRVPDLNTYFKICKYFGIKAPFSIGFKNQKCMRFFIRDHRRK